MPIMHDVRGRNNKDHPISNLTGRAGGLSLFAAGSKIAAAGLFCYNK